MGPGTKRMHWLCGYSIWSEDQPPSLSEFPALTHCLSPVDEGSIDLQQCRGGCCSTLLGAAKLCWYGVVCSVPWKLAAGNMPCDANCASCSRPHGAVVPCSDVDLCYSGVTCCKKQQSRVAKIMVIQPSKWKLPCRLPSKQTFLV